MKRIWIAAFACSLVALCAPASALASHHGKRHTRVRHHAHRARLMTFGSPAQLSQPATGVPAPAAPSEPAGKVASFTEGVLTITLADKTNVSGKVTEETELECLTETPSSGEQRVGDDQGGGDDQSQQSSGEGEHGGPSWARASDFSGGGEQGDGEGTAQKPCTSAALVPGTTVRAAELRLGSTGAVWDKVALVS